MRIQNTSNQNFNGRIKYVNKYLARNTNDNINYFMIKIVGKRQMKDATRKVEREDFNILVSRNEKSPDWFEIRPQDDTDKRIDKGIVYVHEALMKSSFSEAISTVITQYKNILSKTN